MTFTGKTKNLGIIGYPIEHSLSPAIQGAAIETAGIDYSYIAMPVAPEKLSLAVNGLASLGFSGFNVTIPHKVAIMEYLDEIDESARMIGAVNTVAVRDGKLYGYNTDCIGFMAPLHKQGVSMKGKRAALLGAGGAARAIIWGLIMDGVQKIEIGVRNPEKVEPLAAAFRKHVTIEVKTWEDAAFERNLELADLIDGRGGVGRQRVGHRLDRDRGVAAHLDLADADLARDPAVDGAPGADVGVILHGHDGRKIGPSVGKREAAPRCDGAARPRMGSG